MALAEAMSMLDAAETQRMLRGPAHASVRRNR